MEIALLCVVRMLLTCTVLSSKVSVDPLQAPNSVSCGQDLVSGSEDEAYPTISDLTSCLALLLDLPILRLPVCCVLTDTHEPMYPVS